MKGMVVNQILRKLHILEIAVIFTASDKTHGQFLTVRKSGYNTLEIVWLQKSAGYIAVFTAILFCLTFPSPISEQHLTVRVNDFLVPLP